MNRHTPPFAEGDLITNGSSAGTVLALVQRDPTWKCAGYRVMNVGMGPFDGNVGMSSFVADYLANGWHIVPMDWTPIPGGLEERYVWSRGYRWLEREVRKAEK